MTTPKTAKRPPGHDSGYKHLYSHAAMVRDLLCGFVPGDWVHALDFDTLEHCSGSYVTDDLRERADDLIWRVRWGANWLYIYLLLEFQSTIDDWMAVRIQTYLGLLYQDLIRANTLSANALLPPVLPIVLYNGARPWTAATTLETLIEPAPAVLDQYRPQQSYLLIDEQGLARSANLPERNLSSALFRLEASRTPEEARQLLHALADWLNTPEQTDLRRAFAVWIGRVFLPKRMPGAKLPPLNDLMEAQAMLEEEDFIPWTEQWRRDGLAQGLEQGRREAARQLLKRLARHRFGTAITEHSDPLLERITDPEHLEALGEQLLISATGEQWLEALELKVPGSL